MQLKNRFSKETKYLFFDKRYSCMECGSNNMVTLHHIKSTESNSPLNGICLCHNCHAKVGHTFEEESKYLQITIKYLLKQGYEFNKKDDEFIIKNKKYYE